MNCAKCQKKLHPEESLTCGHCLTDVYCSQKCRALDWEAHDCANVLHVNNIASASVFVPYHFEDTLSLETQNELNLNDPIRQSYAMQEVMLDMNIRTRQQDALIDTIGETIEAESLKRGNAYMDAGNYSIAINSENAIGGAMPRDMVFADNKLNPKAHVMGGGKIQAETNQWMRSAVQSKNQTFADTRDTLIFWPGADRVYAENINLPLEGKLDIKLNMNEGSVIKHIKGHYDFLHETATPSDIVQRNMISQLEPRIAGILDSTKELRTIQHTDQQGNRAVITALIEDDSARLIDVEFLAPAATLKIEQEQEYQYAEKRIECDPENVSQLVGLAMGLELRTKSGKATNERLQELSTVISQYTQQKLADPENTNLTAHMAGSVNEAVELMHDELIGARKRFGTNPFKSASKYWRRLGSSKQVVRRAKRVKNDIKLSYTEKEKQLQFMYDDRLALAGKQQENNKIAQDFLDQADQIYSIAGQDTPERRRFRKKIPASPAIILNRRTDLLKTLLERDAVLQDTRMRDKDAEAERKKSEATQRKEERKVYRGALKEQRESDLEAYKQSVAAGRVEYFAASDYMSDSE